MPEAAAGSRPRTPPTHCTESYGKLSGLKGTPHKELQDELARIIEEGGTPEQLSELTVAAAENVAAGLAELFPPDKFPPKKIRSILKDSDEIFLPKKLLLDPIRLQKAIDFRKKYDAQRLAARAALKRPQCDFGIQYMAGFLADLECIDVVRICARLEMYQAAESLADGKMDQAIDALEVMLRLASRLGAEKHGQARAQAAFVRTEAFVVLQAIVQHDKIARGHLERLHDAVRAQLKAWPSDAEATIGDRALGMHAYEMIRAHDVIGLLTPEEIEQFGKEGVLKELTAATVRSVDHDELYYLQTMRKIIDHCDRPYYLRVERFDAIAAELQEMRNSAEFPIVAARLLLPDIRKLHEMLAQDRANWEAWAWALALASATRRQPPPWQTNPLTGEKYRHVTMDQLIVVENFGSGRPGENPSIVVPDLGDQP